MPTLDQIELLEWDRSTVLDANLGQAVEEIQVQRRLGQPDQATMRLVDGAVSVLKDIRRRRVVRFTYSDSEEELWRVLKSSKPYADQGEASAKLQPLWMDLATEVAKQTLTNGHKDVNLTITGQTAQEALNELLSSQWSAPSLLTAGTVESAVNELVALHLRNATHLEGIREITSQVQGEWEAEWDEGNEEYKIHIREQIGATSPGDRVISGKSSPLNRRQLDRRSDATNYFSAISPIGNSEDGVITIADARWNVASATHDSGASETTITLSEEAIWADGVLTGTWFGGFDVISSTAPDQITVSGDASGLSVGKFTATAGGEDLTELSDPTAASTLGRKVKPVEYDVSPFANLLVQEGISDDLAGASGLPTGWNETGTPTTTQVTDPQYAKHGTHSTKVEGGNGDGIETNTFSLPSSENDLASAHVFVYLESGAVRAEFVDDNGDVHPTDVKASSTKTGTLVGFGIGGASVPAQPIKLRIVADAASTVFYVDAVAVTQSGHRYEYQAEMGPTELWKLAADELGENGGVTPDAYASRIYDRAAIDGSTEIQLGDKVTVEDQDLSSFEARIVQITEQLGYKATGLQKSVRIDRKRPSLLDRLGTGPGSGDIGDQPPIRVQRPTVDAEYFQDGTTGKTRLTINDPSNIVTEVEARTSQGEPSDGDTFSAVSAEPDGTYLISEELQEKHNTRVDWRVKADPYATITGSHTFDVDIIPEADYEVLYEKGSTTGTVDAILRWDGDEDVASVEVKFDYQNSGSWDETHQKDGRTGTVTINQNQDMEPGDRFRVQATAYAETGASGTADPQPLDLIYEVPFRTDLAGDYIVERSITERALADAVIAATRVAVLDEPLTTERTQIAVREIRTSQEKNKRLTVIDLEGRGTQEIVLSDDLDPGDAQAQIERQRIIAAEGSPIVEDNGYSGAFERQSADRIHQFIEQSRHTRGIAKLSRDYEDETGVTSLAVEYLTNPVESGDKLSLEGLRATTADQSTAAPFTVKVTVDGSASASSGATTIPVQSVDLDIRKGGQVLLSDEKVKGDIDSNESSISSNSSSIASIDQRVSDNEASIVLKAEVTSGKITKLASIKLESSIGGGSAITLAADQINIEGSAIFHSGTNLTDATTEITGDKVRTGSIRANNSRAAFDLDGQTIWLESSTFGAAGMQAMWDSGVLAGKFYVGDGGSKFIKFDPNESAPIQFGGAIVASTIADAVDIGANGYVKVGSGTPDSDLIGVVIDASGVRGQNSGSDQFLIRATDGKAVAAGGDVTIDAGNGIQLQVGTGITNKYSFSTGAALVGLGDGSIRLETSGNVPLVVDDGDNTVRVPAIENDAGREYGAFFQVGSSSSFTQDTTAKVNLGGTTYKVALETV